MLFFKPKKPAQEMLPPPPPFPGIDAEEDAKPGAGTEKSHEALPEGRFNDIFNDLENDFNALETDLGPEDEGRKIKQKPLKKSREKSKPGKKSQEPKDTSKDLGFSAESELAFGFDEPDNYSLKSESAAKPKEILEAEDEISSAIESIKKQQKPSFFRRLFTKKEVYESSSPKYAEAQAQPLQEEHKDAGVKPKIQDLINSTRQALMNLDLESARKDYSEAIKIYNTLSPEEKSMFYQDLKEIYSERKNAERLKI